MKKVIWIIFTLGILGSYLPNNRPLGINITYGDFSYILCFCLILISNALNGKNSNYIKAISPFIVISMFLIIFGTILSFLKSTNIFESATTLFQYIFIFTILMSVISYLLEKNIKRNLLLILIIICVPHIIIQIFNMLSYIKVFNSLDYILISGSGRYAGFYGNANGLGLNTIMTFIFLVLFSILYSNFKKKILFLFLIAISIVSITLSASFGSIMLLALITIIIFLFLNLKSKLSLIYLSLFLFLILIFFTINFSDEKNFYQSFLPEKLVERIISSEGDGIGSSNIRMALNKEGIYKFAENPFVGLGFTEYPKTSKYGQTVHNTFIATAAEIGIFGLLGISILLIYPIVISRKLMVRVKDQELKLMITFLHIYSWFRILSTSTSGHLISRDPWIPIICIFIIYSYYIIEKKHTEKVCLNE